MTIECSALIRTSILPPPRSREHDGKCGKQYLRGEEWRASYNTLPSRYDIAHMLMDTQQLLLHEQDLHKKWDIQVGGAFTGKQKRPYSGRGKRWQQNECIYGTLHTWMKLPIIKFKKPFFFLKKIQKYRDIIREVRFSPTLEGKLFTLMATQRRGPETNSYNLPSLKSSDV